MARGITSFDDFYTHDTPGGVSYHCSFCKQQIVSYVVGRHERAVRKHVLEKHPEGK